MNDKENPVTPAKTPRRIYLVRHTDTGAERLIRATNAAQARNHAARDTIEVDVAGQEQLVALLTGVEPVRIEDATQRDDDNVVDASFAPAAAATPLFPEAA